MRSMRIVVTDVGLIWNHNNPALEQFKDRVLVVCIDGKTSAEIIGKYKKVIQFGHCTCLPSQYWVSMGWRTFGLDR